MAYFGRCVHVRWQNRPRVMSHYTMEFDQTTLSPGERAIVEKRDAVEISGCQLPSCEVVLSRDAERVGDAIEESKQRCDVDGFCNLFLFPTRKAQLLNIVGGGAVSGASDQFHIFQQGALRPG